MFDNIGAGIAKARKDTSMTVAQLAEITGYSERSIYRYENEQLTPSLYFLATLSKLSGRTIDTIIGQWDTQHHEQTKYEGVRQNENQLQRRWIYQGGKAQVG